MLQECLEVLKNASKSLKISPKAAKVPRSLQKLQKCLEVSKTIPKVPRSSQKCPKVSEIALKSPQILQSLRERLKILETAADAFSEYSKRKPNTLQKNCKNKSTIKSVFDSTLPTKTKKKNS